MCICNPLLLKPTPEQQQKQTKNTVKRIIDFLDEYCMCTSNKMTYNFDRLVIHFGYFLFSVKCKFDCIFFYYCYIFNF